MGQYHKIFNPISNRWINLNSNLGKKILEKFSAQVGGATKTPLTVEAPTKKETKTKQTNKQSVKKPEASTSEKSDPKLEVTTSKAEILVVLITDLGEEVDDQTALSYLKPMCNQLKMRINTLFVGGNISSDQRLKQAELSCGPATVTPENSNSGVWYGRMDVEQDVVDSVKDAQNYKQRLILHIGPIVNPVTDIHSLDDILSKAGGYQYILCGDIGSTLNSKNGTGADQAAKILASKSSDSYIIRTKDKGNTIIPKYTKEISDWNGYNESLKNEIVFLGFKNTIGRAPPLPFTVHLVGPGGANYETLDGISKTKLGLGLDEIFEKVPKGNRQTPEKRTENIKLSKETAAAYFKAAKEHPTWETHGKKFREQQLQILNQKESEQQDGLARMIFAISKLFKLKPTELVSSGNVTMESVNSGGHFHASFEAFKTLISNNPKIELTPAYDLVAAIACVKLIDQKFNSHFNLLEEQSQTLNLVNDEGNVISTSEFKVNVFGFKYIDPVSLLIFLNEV